ncbi:MAG: hypothetical protein IPM66_16480 [Acidobacteriota bacterium]|nr:MAG: hypothetical protein IPM66_16480 [Acidobacteriota bacterium]
MKSTSLRDRLSAYTFYELSQQFPAYNDRLNGMLRAGETEKSAAVKARIRNIRKLINK